MYNKIKDIVDSLKKHPLLTLYVLSCIGVLFWWFNLDISLTTKIACSIFPIIEMFVIFWIFFDGPLQSEDCASVFVVIIFFSFLSFMVLFFPLIAVTKSEQLIHKPMRIIKEDGTLVVLTKNATVYKSTLAKMYLEPDSNICVVQFRNWNEFGKRTSDSYNIGTCNQGK